MHKLICSCFGIGYIKGGGTLAALAICAWWYFFCNNGCSNLSLILSTIIITGVGIWSAGEVEGSWGKDNSMVVIDEAAGMCVSILLLPVQIKYIITAFMLFRFFDIAKPFFIRRLENLPGGWGVMADDLLAGIYANLIMQIIVISNIF